MRARTVAAALLLAATLGACTGSEEPDFDFPRPSAIEVDTPELREIKQRAGIEPCEPGTRPGANDLPAVTLPCLGGGEAVDLSSLEGPVVLNLWAGWCGPCRAEMPVLQEFHEQYADQVRLIGVDVRDPQTTAALELAEELGVTYPLLTDPDDVLAGKPPFAAQLAIPSLYVVDADGTITPVVELVESVDELVDLVEANTGVSL